MFERSHLIHTAAKSPHIRLKVKASIIQCSINKGVITLQTGELSKHTVYTHTVNFTRYRLVNTSGIPGVTTVVHSAFLCEICTPVAEHGVFCFFLYIMFVAFVQSPGSHSTHASAYPHVNKREVFMHAPVQKCMDAHTRTQTHTYTLTHVHVCTHPTTYTNTYSTHTHTHTHTLTL